MHETSETVMSFADGNPSFNYTVPSQPDGTFDNATSQGATMDEFFSRPVKIHEFEWSSSITAFSSIQPWKLFFENPRVANRITNYHLLRCKLNLKFMINGTPFQYGRLMASYIPLKGTTNAYDFLSLDRGLVPQDAIGASQRPHVFLDPTTCAGGEMTLPFFWVKDYLNVPNGDWDFMGQLNIRQLNALATAHSTAVTETVRITVMAWATDVEVAMPTSFNSAGLTAQALPEYEYQAKSKTKKGQDEYPQSGIISGPATAVMNVASALTKVPFLAPYARASEIAAGAVANIARMFGYSRPVMQTEGISEYRPVPTGSYALTNIPDNSHKLALDVKQETTVDSRTVGLDGTDEMNIKSIACRESYLTKFTWTENDSSNAGDVPETLLFTSYVTPYLFDIESISIGGDPEQFNDWYHYTPSGYINNLFASWHTSMIFRFQIVASKFHRGRLRIVYEPGSTTPGNNFSEYNINYSKIVDISEERDVVMRVGHGQDKYWLSKSFPVTDGNDRPQVPFSTTAAGLPAMQKADGHNGTITVYVLNDLETPDSSVAGLQDIEINVFTCAGDDFEVMDPDGEDFHNMTFFTPSTMEPQSTPEIEYPDVIAAARLTIAAMPIRAVYALVMRRSLRILLQNENLSLDALRVFMDDMKSKTRTEIIDLAVLFTIRDNFSPQSTPELETEGEHTDECAADGNQPVNPEPCDLVPTIVRPEYAMTHPGEAVKSLRSIIKRFDYHRTEGGDTAASGRWNRMTQCDYPFYRGTAPSPITLTTNPPSLWNFCSMTHLNYVMAAFSGWRGGIRWKIVALNGSNNSANGISFMVTRSPTSLGYSRDVSNMATSSGYDADAVTFQRRNWFSFAPLLVQSGQIGSKFPGTALSNKSTSNTLEFETPYYQRYKFVPKIADYTDEQVFTRYHSIFIEDGASSAAPTVYDFHVAAGDDMSAFFFTGLPRVLFTVDPDPSFN